MILTSRQVLEQRGYRRDANGNWHHRSRGDLPSVLPSDGTNGTKAKRAKKKREPSNLELKFSEMWTALKGPELTPEHVFCPGRRWRFDFAHVATKIAVEIEGITHQGGRHQRIGGYKADCEKYYAATECGWTVYRLTGNMITGERLTGIMQSILSAK